MTTEDYIKLVASGNVSGYSMAQQYYEQKKRAVLNNIAKNLQNNYPKYAQKSIKKIISSLEEGIINSENIQESEVQKEAANTILTQVAREAAQAAVSLKGDTAFQQAVKMAQQQMQKTQQGKGAEWQYANPTKTFISKVKQNYGSVNLQTLMKQFPSSAYEDKIVQSQLQSYAMRVLMSQMDLIAEKEIYQSSYKNAIAGYFREAAVANGLSQYFSELGVSSGNTGIQVAAIGGKNTEIDIVAGLVDLNKLTKNVTGKTPVNLQFLEQELLRGLNSTALGAQVKSWKLDDPNRNFFPVGLRSSLGNALRKNRAFQYGYSMVANIMFMSQKNRILTALGKNNLLFIDGNKKYWMSDFISYFRSRQMYLQLNMQKEESSNNRRATDEVIIYAYSGQKY